MSRLAKFLERLACRLLGKHAWCPAWSGSYYFCVWCGARRDAVEVEQ